MYTQSYKDANPQGLLIEMKQLLAQGTMRLIDTFWMTETMGFHKLSISGQLTKICLIGKLTNRVTDNIKSNFSLHIRSKVCLE